MKKTIYLGLLLAFAFSALTAPLKAQNINNEEMQAIASKFEEAYNKKDDKALQSLYTKDASKTNADGTVNTGAEAIAAYFAESFRESDAKLTIVQGKTETAADGTVTSSGGYTVTGKTKAGDSIDIKGTYINTLVKEDGQWKISKSVITAM